MKKIKNRYVALLVFIWIALGVSGGIKTHLHYHKNLTVGDLVTYSIGGACIGPVAWLMYLSNVDTVLIEQR